jgi:bifunctional enzyme CysN/CysC
MDLVSFDEAVFATIRQEFRALLGKLEFDRITPIPICARDGDNVTTSSGRMPWYTGGSLLQALENASPVSAQVGPFRMPVQYVNRPDHTFRGYAGTIASGRVRPGDKLFNAAAHTEAAVTRIVSMDGDLAEAGAGDPITLVLDREIDVSRGDVLCANPAPAAADSLDSWIVWMDETPLFRGRAYLLMLGTRTVVATVTEIRTRLDMETLEEISVRELALNEIGQVSISLTHPMVCEPYEISRELGGFILIDRLTRGTVGAGMVTAIRTRNADIVWHRLDVDKAARSLIKGQKPAVLWFTGLSGAGKSTIANQVEKRLAGMGHHTMILDGDNVRHGLNRDLGFSEADRVENIRRIAEVSRLFVEAGLIVIVSFISPYRAERMLARDRVGSDEFLEIFVDTPIEECRRRDPKGLYVKADSGQIRNFTGVDAPYEAPLDPEIRLRTLEGTPDTLAEEVVSSLRKKGIIA